MAWVKHSSVHSSKKLRACRLGTVLAFVCGCFLLVGLTNVQSAFADEVKVQDSSAEKDLPSPDPHMIGLAKDLIRQLEKRHFNDPKTENRVRALLKQSRLRGWKSGPPMPIDLDSPNAQRLSSHATLVEQLGIAFDLYTHYDEAHREAVEALLSATDQGEKTTRLRQVLKLSGGKAPNAKDLDTAQKTFQEFMHDSYGDQQTRAALEVGEDGDRLVFEWDPDRGDFVTRILPGDGSDEIVIHGGVSVTSDGAESKFALQLDATPVTIMDEGRRQAIQQALFGEWYKDEDGSRWSINLAGGEDTGASAPEEEDPIDAEIKRMKAELASILGKKVHIWINGDTGENVVQIKYKRLKPPHVYMKELSRNFYKDKIAQLQRDIEERELHHQTLPIDQYDPLKTDSAQKTSKPAKLEVSEPDGYQYAYENVSYDGKRISARRTLRDLRDISDGRLPKGVREQLISSWSPPEWIELQPRFLVRTKEVVLTGQKWRLHVTSRSSGLLNTGSFQVSSIQDPYIEDEFTLTKAPAAVRLQFVDSSFQPFKGNLPFGKPIVLEAEFEDHPKQPSRRVRLSWSNANKSQKGETSTAKDSAWVDVFRSADREKIYHSEPFVLEASKQKAAVPANEADK